ncbi:hypothetical protein K2Y11_23040 [bacterium]|nr:hypothetical protein [bacterium]
MRSLIIPAMYVLFTLITTNSVRADDLTKFTEDDWKRYEATQSVIRSMPAALQRQGNYAFRSVSSIENDPAFKAWAALNPIGQLVERNKIDTRFAATRPIRQAAVGGYWSFNNPYLGWSRTWNGYGYGSPFMATNVWGGSDLW